MSRADWQRCWRERRADAGAVLIIVLFFTLFFGWVLFSGQVLIAGDGFCYAYPLRTVGWQMIRHGQLPLWTPYVLSGYPLLSMTQLGFGYPLTWGYLFLSGYRAEEIYVFAPFVLAPLFTYSYVRELGRSRLAALLAGLAFAYGGAMTNLLGAIGMPTNSFVWLPLLLFFIERARTRRLMPCLLGAAAAYSLSVLNGHGQAFLYIALVAVPYSGCISAGKARARRHGAEQHKPAGEAWRPFVVALGAIMFGAGVGAFQILETMRAVRLSIRSTLAYVWFVNGSFSPYVALKSLVAPLYISRFADVTAYVSPLVCALAVVACLTVRRFGVRDDMVRVYFWMTVAVVSGVLMLGHYTPLFPLLYHVPLLNSFGTPSRHAFEWTFALSVLAAYGWDACQRLSVRRVTGLIPQKRALLIGCGALALCALTSVLWWRATVRVRVPPAPTSDPTTPNSWYAGLPISSYLGWKLALFALMLVVLWLGSRLVAPGGRKALLGAVVVLACFAEPYIMVTNWWAGFLKMPARLVTPAPLTRYLQPYPPQQNRVYTRIDLFEDENAIAPRVDSLNLTALYGLHNVAGYEPLVLERYSRALGNVQFDGINPLPGYPPNDTLLADNSHVLDLLNTTVVASFSQLRTSHAALPEHDGVKLNLTEAGTEIKPQTTELLGFTDTFADALVLVTSLANSADVAQGTPVARLLVLTTDGQRIERSLRAGIDTAEWAHERPDVRVGVRHTLAPVFDRQVGDTANSYQACRYLTQISLGARVRVKEIEIENLSDHASLALWAASLRDTTNGQSEPLSRKLLYLARNPARWQIDRSVPDVLVLHNTRALPRAWLVTEAEAVESEEALRRIRGEGTIMFDPRRTALLEVKPTELPPLPGGDVYPQSSARITSYEPNRLVIETNAPTTTVLVVSEIYYPGWIASVDGQPTPIYPTDYLLRGVPLPTGPHQVEMRYTAPAARNGAIISALTLLVLCSMAVSARRTRKKEKNETRE